MHNSPLSRFPMINAQSFSEIETFAELTVGAKLLSMPKTEDTCGLAVNGYHLPNISVWHARFLSSMFVGFLEDDYFRVQLHRKGSATVKIGSDSVSVGPQQAVISPAVAQIDYAAGYEQKVLRVSRSGLMRKITQLTGAPQARSLEFENTFNPDTPETRSLMKTFYFLLESINALPSEAPSAFLSELEQVVTTSLLYSCKNNYTNMLQRQEKSAAPWQVCQVEDYIEAHWDKPIDIEDILKITECSERSLYRAFQTSRGYSPMAFVKRVRLEHARRILSGGNATSVTETAMACGFLELGRFSRDYKDTFGELPSATLKRKK